MPRTIVELHAIQTVPPSCINRDDAGIPKTSWYGGTLRARVSSQAWKRAMRESFVEHLGENARGVRSTRLAWLTAQQALAQKPTLGRRAVCIAADLLAKAGSTIDGVDKKKPVGGTEKTAKKKSGAADETLAAVEAEADETSGDFSTGALLFLSPAQCDRLVEAVCSLGDAQDYDAALKAVDAKALLDGDHTLDIAAFGRMVAGEKDLEVEGALHVAHAISVHEVALETDFFTATDDASTGPGSAMMGTKEFCSATLYRYATLDVDALLANLGDTGATVEAVGEIVRAFVTSMPSGGMASWGNATVPDAVVVTVVEDQPVNAVGAFEDEVPHELGKPRSAEAARRMASRMLETRALLGEDFVEVFAAGTSDSRAALEDVFGSADETVKTIAEGVRDVCARRLGAGAA